MDQAENLRKIMQQKEEQAKEAARVIALPVEREALENPVCPLIWRFSLREWEKVL